jgi:hypothetical protein
MKVNNNENEEGTAQSAVEDCRILERQFAYGLAQISSLSIRRDTAGLKLLRG